MLKKLLLLLSFILIVIVKVDAQLLLDINNVYKFVCRFQSVMSYDSACTIENLYAIFGPYNEEEISYLSDSLSTEKINKIINNTRSRSRYLVSFRKKYNNAINPRIVTLINIVKQDSIDYANYYVYFKNQKDQKGFYIIGHDKNGKYFFMSDIILEEKSLMYKN